VPSAEGATQRCRRVVKRQSRSTCAHAAHDAHSGVTCHQQMMLRDARRRSRRVSAAAARARDAPAASARRAHDATTDALARRQRRVRAQARSRRAPQRTTPAGCSGASGGTMTAMPACSNSGRMLAK
jgi:hypothetical protein